MELCQGPPPDPFLFTERVVSMVTKVLNEEYFLKHYPNCDTDIILAHKTEPYYQISHIWQLRCSPPHVRPLSFPTSEPYVSTAIGTILIRSDPDNNLFLQVTTDFPAPVV